MTLDNSIKTHDYVTDVDIVDKILIDQGLKNIELEKIQANEEDEVNDALLLIEFKSGENYFNSFWLFIGSEIAQQKRKLNFLKVWKKIW